MCVGVCLYACVCVCQYMCTYLYVCVCKCACEYMCVLGALSPTCLGVGGALRAELAEEERTVRGSMPLKVLCSPDDHSGRDSTHPKPKDGWFELAYWLPSGNVGISHAQGWF